MINRRSFLKVTACAAAMYDVSRRIGNVEAKPERWLLAG
jgi:hypothetical protein